MTKEQKWRTLFIAMQLIIIVALIASYFIREVNVQSTVRTIAYCLLVALLVLRFIRPSLLRRNRE